MYKTLIQPLLDYCEFACRVNLDQRLAAELQKLQNSAERIITFQGYDISICVPNKIRKQLN